MHNPRLQAATLLARVLQDRDSLASLPIAHTAEESSAVSLVRELCLGVCRHHPQLSALTEKLIAKPLKTKDSDVLALIHIGLYQLFYMRIPDHAAINETVACVRKPWAKGLVNAVLRNALRQYSAFPDAFSQDPAFRLSHPQWLAQSLQNDWLEKAETIMEANNQRAPMTLRINPSRINRNEYLDLLQASGIQAQAGQLTETAVILDSTQPAQTLPGFMEGAVSIQDEASQLLPGLLNLAAGMKILDACAAPGGKTSAMLEHQPGLEITAVDNEERRLLRMRKNLERLGQASRITMACCDAVALPDRLVPANGFDRIALDAPCSATGVIRRHPDIKVLRKPEQIKQLAQKQASLLDALWPLLSPGGLMVYSTCSLLRIENTTQVSSFLARTPDARHVYIDATWGIPCETGRQLLPGSHGQDGFYYALLQKC